LFIGSASETEQIAIEIGEILADRVDLHHWAEVFALGEYNLQALQREAAECDFAVFVWGKEDRIQSKGEESRGPRDNVRTRAGRRRMPTNAQQRRSRTRKRPYP
jgi:predicted nucleotide-binding protein